MREAFALTPQPETQAWPKGKPMFRTAGEQHWRTPIDVYAGLDREFQFTLDPCPLGGGSVDGLVRSWVGQRVYCNPPYAAIAQWLAKAREANCAVYLVPARTDTRWWHEYALGADEIRFIRGRLRFNGSKRHTAPFPSVVLVYGAAA